MAIISRLFDDYSSASKAVQELEAAGLSNDKISIAASNADNWYSGDTPRKATDGRVDRDRDGTDDRAEGAATGAGIGAAVGGAAGLLAGLGLIAIPGIGPVVAAGWLASTALGAAAVGTAGGLIGALTQAGVGEEDAHAYAEGVRRGGTLVTARVPDGERSRYEAILDRACVDLRERTSTWRNQGWKRFDPNAKPYTADEARREREMYSAPRRTGTY